MDNKMKIIMIAIMTIIAVDANAFKLSKRKEKKILKNLSKACEKVWCTGNYKIEFESLKCKETKGVETKCILKAQFMYNNVKNFNDENSFLRLAGVQESYPGICYFLFKNEDQLNASTRQLTKKFYKDVDTCVTNIEHFIEK
jgi:hypothetical protein